MSQAEQKIKLLNMQLIILKALSVSDSLSGPVIEQSYSGERRPEGKENVSYPSD